MIRGIIGYKGALRTGMMASIFAILAALALFNAGFCGCSKEAAKQVEELSEDSQAVSPVPGDTGSISASQQALDQAKGASLPVLLNFHSTQCTPCIEIEKVIKEVEPEYAGRVAFIIVDVYDASEQDLCAQYGIETIPTTVFLDTTGQITEGYTGVIDAASMRQMLDRLVSGPPE